MTSGEDLLLLAIEPHSGLIREADRIKFALRASALVDLALAHRITMNANRIKVLDAAATGDKRLDKALASLGASSTPSLRAWPKDTTPGCGIINEYLSTPADQGAVRLEHRRERASAPMQATLLDQARRDEAAARVDRVAHGQDGSGADADRALAGLVHSCGLDRRLYRSPVARRRIARLGSETGTAPAAADTEVADAVGRAVSDGVAQSTTELVQLLRYEHRIEGGTAQSWQVAVVNI
jgi:Golgi phosphoprotein 3 (GPP34)